MASMVNEISRRTHRRRITRLAALALLLALAPVGPWVPVAAALRPLPGIPTTGVKDIADPGLECLGGITAALHVSPQPQPIALGQTVTLSWSITRPYGCEWARIYFSLHGHPGVFPVQSRPGVQAVAGAGMLTIQPIASDTISLHATYNGQDLIIASAYVGVTLPRIVYIHANHLAPQLVQALQSTDRADRIIVVADGVELDLTQWVSIRVAAGVTLRGGRGGKNPGARLYTRTRPSSGLLWISGDNVRITGLRIEGPDMDTVAEDVMSRGIFAGSQINIQIDHNEIYGWTGAAIEFNDKGDRISFMSPYTLRVHDNYIHHNQHAGGNGYGVASRYGAYVLIEHNVFDWNRHAIAADGREGTGYAAFGNLVLPNGGLHGTYLGVERYTHQFDVHGSDSCWGIDHNCGPAGHSFYIYHNTFLYDADNAIKLRGTPRLQPYGMFVSYNVFAHDDMDDAVAQTESGMHIGPGNQLGNEVDWDQGSCDFDGDGLTDYFMATGATWWYASAGQLQWWYLNTSTKRLSEISLGYFDGDNRCDVFVDGTVYSGGKPTPPAPKPFLSRAEVGLVK